MTAIYVDSRLRASGTDSNFEILLRETVHLESARVRVDNIRFVDSFFTTDLGKYVYYKKPLIPGSFTYYDIPEQAYTGAKLAAALQAVTGRTTVYTEATNSLAQVAVPNLEWLSDEELRGYTSGFPPGASPTNAMSLNSILGPAFTENNVVTWSFCKMPPYDHIFLRSKRLTCNNVHGPRGEHDLLAMIPLSEGIGRVQVGSSALGVYHDLPDNLTLRHLDFQLTDFMGNVVNLRGRSLSFQLTFD